MHADADLPFWTPAGLANHLWQSSIIALGLLLLIALCTRLPARTRLALGWMALAKFALPFGIFAALVSLVGGDPDRWPVTRVFPAPFSWPAPAGADADSLVPGSHLASPQDLGSASDSVVASPLAGSGDPGDGKTGVSTGWILGFVWLLGFAGLQAWWVIGGLRLRRRLLAEGSEVSAEMMRHIEAAARKARVRDLPRCLSGGQGSGPGLLGVWQPILTLPVGLEKNLTAAELESVLLHELIHLQRRDPFWLALHVTAICALWFNPLAWLLSRWIRLETEKACDERVLELTGQPETYAQGILKVVHLALGLPEPRLLNVITPPVVSRVKNILRPGSIRDRRWPRFAVLAAGASLIALGGNTGPRAVAAITPTPSTTLPPSAETSRVYTTIFLEPLPEGADAISSLEMGAGPTFGAATTSGTAPGNLPANLPLAGNSAATATSGPSGDNLDVTRADHPAEPLPITPAPTSPDAAVREALAAATESAGNATPDHGYPGSQPSGGELPRQDVATAVLKSELAAEAPVAAHDDQTAPSRAVELPVPGSLAISGSALAPAQIPDQPLSVSAQTAPAPEAPRAHHGATNIYSLQEVTTPPVATRQIPPAYPPALKRSGVEGAAMVSFVVKANGEVEDVRPVHSTDPLFAQAAVNAIRGWKFSPGLKDGVAVATSTELPVNFRLTSGDTPAAPASLPPAARFASLTQTSPAKIASTPRREAPTRTYSLRELDIVPTPMLQSAPVYPADLKRTGIEGSVELEFIVDQDGIVREVRTLKSTDRRFEPAAVAAVGKWKFRPGRLAGQPVPATLSISLNFHLQGNR